MGMTDGSRTKSETTPVDIWAGIIIKGVQIQYNETCSTERAVGFMVLFKY
jgi:hypothetical protein